jgi:hypothetical protein
MAAAATTDIIAALRSAWSEYQPAEKRGLAFGQRLYELRAEAEVVQGGTSFYNALKEATIPHSTAYFWIDRYEASVDLKPLHKEKRPNRTSPESFEPIQKMALTLLLDGFEARSAKEPEKQRLIQSAKDWAQARLARTDL